MSSMDLKRACVLISCVAATALSGACGGPGASPDGDGGVQDTGVGGGGGGGGGGGDPLEDEIVVLVNQRRAMGANCGGTQYAATGPMVMNAQLRAAARAHSLDMGTRNYFDHDSPEGTTPFQRIAAAGYTGSPQGENIAAGGSTAERTMTQWMNSPGHCRNIMNPQYRSIGVGYANVSGSRYTHYWTQTFGGR